VDLVLCRKEGELLSQVPPDIHLVEVGISPMFKVIRSMVRLPPETAKALLPLLLRTLRRKIRSLPSLESYLKREHPEVVLASTPVPNLLSLWAGRLTAAGTRVIVKQDSSLASVGRKGRNPLR
jgi:hypothetical protein